MRRILIFYFIILAGTFACNSLMGQGIEDLVKNRFNAYDKKTTLERKPAPLPGVREADVTWSKTIWRLIDMREKMNQHFYFPTTELQGRNNLINILVKGIKDNVITAFDASDDNNEFVKPVPYDQIVSQFGAGAKTVSRRNFETGQMEDVTVQQEMNTDQTKQLIVKEIWYFDKQKSTLQVRILGICPIKLYYRDEDLTQEVLLRKKLFWVYYPEVRKILAKNEALNDKNGARNFSFDDLFLMRNFDSYIIKEENVYNNRYIQQYAADEFASKESERIKNSIFNYEQDLWEY